MFKKILYIIVALIIGQLVLSFNIATIRSEKRTELEQEALLKEEKDFNYILKNINGKYIGSAESYYNLTPVFKYENKETLNIYFFEFYAEITLNKELVKDKILYILITDVNEKYKDMVVEKDESSLNLEFNGEKKIEKPYQISLTTHKLSFYELIFSAKKIKDDEYGTVIKNVEIKDAKKETIFNLQDVLPDGINFETLTGAPLKDELTTNEQYGKCLTRNEHYEALSYSHRMGKIIGSLSIYVIIALALAFLLFRPRKRRTKSAYSNYKAADYKSNYAQNIKTKDPSRQIIEAPKEDIQVIDTSEEPKKANEEDTTKK